MIALTVNGESLELDALATVVQLTNSMNLQGKRFAVEVNGEIVPASQHANHALFSGDKVEIVGAIGGG